MCGFAENPYRNSWKSIGNVLQGRHSTSSFALNSKAKTFGIMPD